MLLIEDLSFLALYVLYRPYMLFLLVYEEPV